MNNHRKRVSKSVDPLIGETLVVDGRYSIEFTNSVRAGEFIDTLRTPGLLRWVAFANANQLIGAMSPRDCTPAILERLAKRRHIKTYIKEAVAEMNDDIRRMKEKRYAK
jgi:hypothetical protein